MAPVTEPQTPSPVAPPAREIRRIAPSSIRRIVDSFVNGVTSLGVSLGAYVVLGRFVSPAEYGRASVILAMWGLCATTVDWCGNMMMRFGPVELGRANTLRVTVATRLVFATPLALTVVGAPLYFGLVRGWSWPLLVLTVLYLVSAAAFGVAHWSAVAAQRFRPLTIANALIRAMPPVTILTLVAVGRRPGAEALATAAVVGMTLGALVLIVPLRSLFGWARPDRELLRAMWRYCLPSLIAAPAAAAMNYIDPLVLQRSVSDADVGRYQLGYLTVTLFGTFGASFNRVLSPELVSSSARGEREAVEHYRRRVQPRLACLGLVACAGACLVPPLARAMLPTVWAPAAETFAILTVAGGLMIGVWSFHPLVTVTDSVWALQIASMASAATNVALDFALAPRWGITGVALANVAAWAVQLVLLAILLHRRINARRICLVPLLVGAAAALPAVIAAARRGP